jgi:hypothetical protein
VAGIGGTPRRPVVAEDIRDLQCWTQHGRRRYPDFTKWTRFLRFSGRLIATSA